MLRLVLLVLLSVAAVPAEIIRLRDGTLLHGTILEFDEAGGILFERVDSGGQLRLRWEHLPPAEVKRLKAARGFTGEDPEPYLVPVVHLLMRNGTTESGVLVEEGRPDLYLLRRRGATDEIPRSHVASLETGVAAGLEYYPPDELYQLLVTEGGAPTDAASHFQLGVTCEGAGLYEPAREHYQAARALDPTLKPDLIAARLQRLAIKLEDAAETAALGEVRNRLYRRQFEVAADLAVQFRAKYPRSRQMGDLLLLEAEIRRRKSEAVAGLLVTDYLSWLDKRVAKIARDDSLTLDMAQELLETTVHTDLVKSLAERYVLSEQAVEDLWEARGRGSVRSVSYGTGTFILGKERALQFGRFEEEEGAGGGAADATEVAPEDEFGDIIEKVKRQRAQRQQERQAATGSAVGLGEEGSTPEDWWASAETEDRIRWLTAWYAEFSGRLQLVEARGRNCRHCDAVGSLEGINEKGEIVRRACPVCQGLKFERLVRFR